MGALVLGTSLPSPARASLAWSEFSPAMAGLIDFRADVQDSKAIRAAALDFGPQITLHLAAQAIVLDSYSDMAGTWGPNVMGSLNVMQASADAGAKAIVMVTSDKCYENVDWEWGYRESDALGGADPYSASKAACEILVSSWRRSRGQAEGICVGSARAGNVIGGGDNAPHRLLPDMLSAFGQGLPGQVRNPDSTRPFQHALEPLSGYLLLARRLWEQSQGGPAFDEAFNFGPKSGGEKSARWLAEVAVQSWGGSAKVEFGAGKKHGHEARVLMLDSAKASKRLGWEPAWSAQRAIEMAATWEKARLQGPGLALAQGLAQLVAYKEDALGRER